MRKLLFFAMSLLLFAGCADVLWRDDLPADIINEAPALTTSGFETSDFDPGRSAILGERLENPYSLENMKAAFNNLPVATQGNLSADDVIVNTHNYIKFTFETDEQFYFIRNEGIELFFIPLDMDIVQGGYYKDEGSEDDTRVRYCVVALEQMALVNACGAEYEILSEMFMPDEGDYAMQSTTTHSETNLSATLVDELVREAYTLTGNEDWLSDDNENSGNAAPAASRPQGRIQYRDYQPDGSFEDIGMQGLKVRATRLLKVATGICDVNGYYSCDNTFKNNWKYETTFERNDFDVNNGRNGSYAYVSGKTMSPFSFTIWEQGSKGYFMSTIFRACHHYYYENINGLRRPPLNSEGTQMKLAARMEGGDGENGNIAPGRRFLGLGNAIHIFNPDRDCWDIYSTVIHELAHASHWNLSKSDYNQENEEMYRIRNSWARGVQYSLVRLKYPTYPGGPTILPRYTQLVVDLMDTAKSQIGPNYGKDGTNGDSAYGYTIRQIEDCLHGVRTWDQWRTKIYNAYPSNSTRGQLQALFDAWDAH